LFERSKAVVAFPELQQAAQCKTTFQYTFRRKIPTEQAIFLQNVSGMAFVSNPEPTASSDQSVNKQTEFDSFIIRAC